MSLIIMHLKPDGRVAPPPGALNNAPPETRPPRPERSPPEPADRSGEARGLPRDAMAENAQLIQSPPTAESTAAVRAELAALITAALNLEVAPADIDPAAPLYGEGLGLDSIDILEVALVISKQYGIQLKADSEENHVIFSSLNALSEFVAAQRTK
jgi:acyl carrier protein